MQSAKVDGKRCTLARESIPMTLLELAEAIKQRYPRGVDASMLSLIENDKRQPSAKLFRAMCEALDVSGEELLVRDSEAA